MNLSFSKLFYSLASMALLIALLYLGKSLFIPMAFAMIFAFILYPIVKWLQKKGFNQVLAIASPMVSEVVLILGVIVLFSSQIVKIASEYDNFLSKLRTTWESSLSYINNKIGIIPDLESKNLLDQVSNYFADSGFVIISDTIAFTSSFFSYLLLSLILTFLFLFYHAHLTRSLALVATEEKRKGFIQMLKNVQQVGQKYFTGMGLLILVLSLLNSIGLLVVGIDYPFFFGFLAGILAFIPYVGTIVGGLLPTLYAFVTYDSYWYPLGVIFVFWVVQFLEGNFLSPKIVGGHMHINALVSILSLIAGGMIWGLPGMILFLPMTAMLKVVFDYYENLKPVAALMGERPETSKENKLIAKLNKLFQK